MNYLKQERFMSPRKKQARNLNIEKPDEIKIENFILSVLSLCGLHKQKDFTVKQNQLFIKKNPLRGKLIHVLKETYPQYNYYWETPRTLIWF